MAASIGQTTAGTSFAVSASAPATYTQVGFVALTWLSGATCEVVSIGDVGVEWTTTDSNTLCTDPIVTKKSRQKMMPMSLTLNYVKGDAMQAALNTAFATKTALISVQITEPNGTDKQWCQAQVQQMTKKFGGGDDFITLDLVLHPQNSWVVSA